MKRLVNLLIKFPKDGKLDEAYERELKAAVYRLWQNGGFDSRANDDIRFQM